MKCCLIQIDGNTPRESSNSMTSLPQNRLMFTLQSGSPATLKKHNVLRAFLRFCDVGYLFYKTGFTFGWVEQEASNLLLPITTFTGVWEIHTFKDFNMVKPPKDAFSHQILLEFKELPTSWENLIIAKEFFKKFGEVNGTQMIVVSFKESIVAVGIVGTRQKILYCTTEVKAVSPVNQEKMRICFSR